MTDKERIKALYQRIDTILEQVPDNPIYEEKDARSLQSYIQAVRMLEDIEKERRKN